MKSIKMKRIMRTVWIAALFAAAGFTAEAPAHCDTMDGPVIHAAQQALDAGDVNLVLVWVRKADEGTLREAFRKTQEVRKLSPAARRVADSYFFETLVRIHRAGEGEPYTGIKPAGTDPGPAVRAAEKSLAEGTPEPAAKLLGEAIHRGLHERYEAAAKLRGYKPDDVEAGRRYVEAYVRYLHYVEKLFEDAGGKTAHDSPGSSHAH